MGELIEIGKRYCVIYYKDRKKRAIPEYRVVGVEVEDGGEYYLFSYKGNKYREKKERMYSSRKKLCEALIGEYNRKGIFERGLAFTEVMHIIYRAGYGEEYSKKMRLEEYSFYEAKNLIWPRAAEEELDNLWEIESKEDDAIDKIIDYFNGLGSFERGRDYDKACKFLVRKGYDEYVGKLNTE